VTPGEALRFREEVVFADVRVVQRLVPGRCALTGQLCHAAITASCCIVGILLCKSCDVDLV